MINRSKIKYALKRTLPTTLFKWIEWHWQHTFIGMVEAVDKNRLKKFTTYHAVTLTHRNKSFSLFISPLNGFIDAHIYLYGVYEPFILDIVDDTLQDGMTFVDVGANIGEHSMFAAAIVGKHGSVHSFEPIPRIYAQLGDSIRHNHFGSIITTHNVALGEKEHTQILHINQKNIGGSSLVEDSGVGESIEVNIRRGDRYLTSLTRIDLMKIDVEGYEYEVLQGSHKALLTHKPVILLEFSGRMYFEQKQNHGEMIISLLEELGYAIYDIEDDMKQIVSAEEFVATFESSRKQTNLLCKPRVALAPESL